ncbi:MAG TPA: hypothetical protein VGM94_15075 [Galbitalea sp.]|jgi:deoxyadenosine/deoxycytidine kinase
MFIGFMGVPGCGKSATAAALAEHFDQKAFLEPEEEQWSDLVMKRNELGAFGPYLALQWFRNERVPGYLEASRLHQKGGTSVVDSMYDKLAARYLSDKAMNWMIPPSNPYFAAALQGAQADFAHLPDPTHVVFVTVDPATWQELLRLRGRTFDGENQIGSDPKLQDVMYKATRKYCNEHGIEFIVHEQMVGSADATAKDVAKLLDRITR